LSRNASKRVQGTCISTGSKQETQCSIFLLHFRSSHWSSLSSSQLQSSCSNLNDTSWGPAVLNYLVWRMQQSHRHRERERERAAQISSNVCCTGTPNAVAAAAYSCFTLLAASSFHKIWSSKISAVSILM
jgi:hypothetical protein